MEERRTPPPIFTFILQLHTEALTGSFFVEGDNGIVRSSKIRKCVPTYTSATDG